MKTFYVCAYNWAGNQYVRFLVGAPGDLEARRQVLDSLPNGWKIQACVDVEHAVSIEAVVEL